jgi:hypothetical protein
MGACWWEYSQDSQSFFFIGFDTTEPSNGKMYIATGLGVRFGFTKLGL